MEAPPHIRRDYVRTTVPHSGQESSIRAAPLYKTALSCRAGERRHPIQPVDLLLPCSPGSTFDAAQDAGFTIAVSGRHHAVRREPPQDDQQLSCQHDYHQLAHAHSLAADALAEPAHLDRAGAAGLPQPRPARPSRSAAARSRLSRFFEASERDIPKWILRQVRSVLTPIRTNVSRTHPARPMVNACKNHAFTPG